MLNGQNKLSASVLCILTGNQSDTMLFHIPVKVTKFSHSPCWRRFFYHIVQFKQCIEFDLNYST